MAQATYIGPIEFMKENWLRCVLLILAAYALYFQSINDDYILDDKIVLSENVFVQDGVSGIIDIFTHDSFYGYFQKQTDVLEGGRYRPLSLATFALEYEIFGLNPLVGHIVNLLLYGLIGICLYLFFTWFQQCFNIHGTGWLTIGFMGALLFIFHPIHSEAIVNIKGRDEILSLLFSILALLTFTYAQLKAASRPWKYYLIGGFFLFLALMAKENAITFLLVIPVTLYFFQKKIQWKNLITPTIVCLVVAGLYLLLRYLVLGDTIDAGQVDNPLNNPFFGLSTIETWGTIFYTLERYIELFLVPINLSHDYYPYAIPVADFGYLRVWIAVLLYIGLAVVAIYGLFKRSILSWSAFYYLCTLSVVSNVFVVVGTTMNERFVFMSSVAFSLLTAYLLYRLRKLHYWSALVLFIGLIGFYGYQTYERVPDWSSYLALNKSAVENAPHSGRSHLFYGTALFKKGKVASTVPEKIALFEKALKQFELSQEVFRRYGTDITQNFVYNDAQNMKAGVAAELYKLNAINLHALLGKFKEVLRLRPNNGYIPKFLKYLNARRGADVRLVDFYRDVTQHIFLVYARKISPQYYDTALTYINMGLSIAPNDQLLNRELRMVYRAIGKPNMPGTQ